MPASASAAPGGQIGRSGPVTLSIDSRSHAVVQVAKGRSGDAVLRKLQRKGAKLRLQCDSNGVVAHGSGTINEFIYAVGAVRFARGKRSSLPVALPRVRYSSCSLEDKAAHYVISLPAHGRLTGALPVGSIKPDDSFFTFFASALLLGTLIGDDKATPPAQTLVERFNALPPDNNASGEGGNEGNLSNSCTAELAAVGPTGAVAMEASSSVIAPCQVGFYAADTTLTITYGIDTRASFQGMKFTDQ